MKFPTPVLLRQILPVLFLLSAVPASAQEHWISRLSAEYTHGDGVGYSHGYSSVDWFLPLLPDGTDDMWFGDFRAILANDAEFSSNLGTGYRWFVPEQNRIYGLNAYWDSRQQDAFTFNQVGIGFESFGELVDVEVNGYTPAINDTDQRVAGFQGNNLLVHTSNALSGVDYMLGYNVPQLREFRTRVLGGGYYYDSSETRHASGWRVRLETAFQDWISFSAQAQDDDLFGRNVVVSVELRQPLEHDSDAVRHSMRHKYRSSSGGGHDRTLRHRLADPVRRQRQIVLTQKTEVARDLGGTPLTFIHVVPGAAGTGTIENPYGTISAAMADGLAPTSIVYTPQGGSFIEDVTLVAGTKLWSNGPTRVVQTQQGSLHLPFSGASSDLTALPASITGNMALASNTEVSGFELTGMVTGNNVSNVTLDTNRIRQPLAVDTVVFTDSTGVVLNNLRFDESGGRAIGIDNSSATLSDITLEMVGGDAIEINNGAGNNTVAISDTTITATAGEGIDANLTGAGDLSLSVSQTSVSTMGEGITAVKTGAAMAQLDVKISETSIGSSNAAGVIVQGLAGGSMTFVSEFRGNTISAATMGGASFTDVTFDATPGGAADVVNVETLVIGTGNARVTGNGLSLVNTTGALNLGDIDIANTSSVALPTVSGLMVDTSPGLTLSSQAGSTIDTLTGAALDLTSVTTTLVFDSITSVNSPNRVASFDTVDGSLAVTTTTATDAAMRPFAYSNIPLASPFSASFGTTTITSQQGPLIVNNETRVGDTTGVTAIYNPLTIIFP